MEECEEDYESMTDGQMADYEAGLWRSFWCPKCKTVDLFDGFCGDGTFENKTGFIDDRTYEDVIDRAIKKRCFIEVTSLVHNVIEHYLRSMLEEFINHVHGIEYDFKDMFDKQKREEIEKKAKECNVEEKYRIIQSRGKSQYLKYLADYTEMCYIFNLIDRSLFNKIIKFNEDRNTAIHKLLKKRQNDENLYKYMEIVETARLGREIQLRLSPLKHSDKDIKRILKPFDINEVESQTDPFLS